MEKIYILTNDDGDIIRGFVTEEAMDKYMAKLGAFQPTLREYNIPATDLDCTHHYYGNIVEVEV